jgi:hypothetical protein
MSLSSFHRFPRYIVFIFFLLTGVACVGMIALAYILADISNAFLSILDMIAQFIEFASGWIP